MIDHLSKEHFEEIRLQMEWEEEGKITLKSIPDLMDMPVYHLSITMPNYFCDFETFLSQSYGVEGFPLDYVVQQTLTATSWGDFIPQEQCCPWQGELMLDFFQFEESNYHCCRMAPFVDPTYEDMVRNTPEDILLLSMSPASMQTGASTHSIVMMPLFLPWLE